jgi:hypothetical protein
LYFLTEILPDATVREHFWAPGAEAHRHYGTSEFVVAPGTSVAVTDEVGTDAYCAPGRIAVTMAASAERFRRA